MTGATTTTTARATPVTMDAATTSPIRPRRRLDLPGRSGFSCSAAPLLAPVASLRSYSPDDTLGGYGTTRGDHALQPGRLQSPPARERHEAADSGGHLRDLELAWPGVTGGPVRIGEGRNPLARSQILSVNSQMASGAVSATGSPERMPQNANKTPIPARRANGPPTRPIITSGRGRSLDRHIR